MEGNNITLSIADVSVYIYEMIEDFEKLINSGKLPSDAINGFVFMLSIADVGEDKIGANVSLSLLERTLEDRCNIITSLANKLDIKPEQLIDYCHGKRKSIRNLFKVRGR